MIIQLRENQIASHFWSQAGLLTVAYRLAWRINTCSAWGKTVHLPKLDGLFQAQLDINIVRPLSSDHYPEGFGKQM